MEENLCLAVKYQLSGEFRSLVESIQGCRVLNVVEIKSCEILQFVIECPTEKQNTVVDYAFMTWIKNPVFQKILFGIKKL